MAFTLDYEKIFLESNSVYQLRNIESMICVGLKKSPRVTQTKLYECLTVATSSNKTCQMLSKILLL